MCCASGATCEKHGMVKIQRTQHPRSFFEAPGNVFCAGGDVKEFENYTPEQAENFVNFLETLDNMPMFTVGVVQGPCFGGGVGLLAVSDHVAMTNPEKVKLCFSGVKIGMVPATISPYVLRKIGYAATRSLFWPPKRSTLSVACSGVARVVNSRSTTTTTKCVC